MGKEAAALLSEALQLSPEERRELASELWASLDDNPAILEAWLDVAEARAEGTDRGEAEAVPWSDARERIFGTG